MLKETLKEISSITSVIQENGLSIREKVPIIQGQKITWNNQSDITIALKNIPYSEKYAILEKEGNYNFKMLDGALLQFMYEFDKTQKQLKSHRLAFLPAPYFERYDTIPEEYEQYYFAGSEFHDIIEKNIVTFPIRFDFNADSQIFKEIEHPFSHASLGEYDFCSRTFANYRCKGESVNCFV